MKITVLGSGSFFIDKDHSAPAYLIEYKGQHILLDCGPGSEVQMAKIGFDPLDLDYIFLSHFHADHTSDLFPVLMRAPIFEKSYEGVYDKQLQIIGPRGTFDFIRKLSDAYDLSNPVKYPKYTYSDYCSKMDFGNFGLETFNVDHLGADAFALRFSFGGKILVYSGDTTYTEGIIKASKNADLLIIDCAAPKGRSTSAHMGTEEVGNLCKENNVKKVILSHQVPPGYRVDMVGQVRESFDGEVVLAKDLMEIEL